MFVCNLTVDRPEHHQETHPVIVVFGLRAVDSTKKRKKGHYFRITVLLWPFFLVFLASRRDLILIALDPGEVSIKKR